MFSPFRRRAGRWGVSVAAACLLAACSQLPLPVSTPESFTDAEVSFTYPDNFTVKRLTTTSVPTYEFRVKRLAFMDNQKTAAMRKSTKCLLRMETFNAASGNLDARLSNFLTLNILRGYKNTTDIRSLDIPEGMEGTILARAIGDFTISGTERTVRNGVTISSRRISAPFKVFGQISAVDPAASNDRHAVMDCYYPDRFQNLVDALSEDVARTIAENT